MSEGLVQTTRGATTRSDGAIRPRPMWDSIDLRPCIDRPARFDFRTGLPDAALFPHQAWRRLVTRALRAAEHGEPTYQHPAGQFLCGRPSPIMSASRAALRLQPTISSSPAARSRPWMLWPVCFAPGDRIAVEDPAIGRRENLFRSLGVASWACQSISTAWWSMRCRPGPGGLRYAVPPVSAWRNDVAPRRRRYWLGPSATTQQLSRTTTIASSGSGTVRLSRCRRSTPGSRDLRRLILEDAAAGRSAGLHSDPALSAGCHPQGGVCRSLARADTRADGTRTSYRWWRVCASYPTGRQIYRERHEALVGVVSRDFSDHSSSFHRPQGCMSPLWHGQRRSRRSMLWLAGLPRPMWPSRVLVVRGKWQRSSGHCPGIWGNSGEE